ncbi:MAG TPA: prenyltransferase/squalene oxidase repeat-containing protein, partial [Gemmataceae bacterium]|nr:prenyltransferase/squalene oxidase repeat-containing protein [Gemmataceae bacterium]
RLPADFRTRHADYLRRLQNPDGGWPGREGGSDLYYTAFALRGLIVLDALTPDICQKSAAFLKHSLTQQASVVDFFSLLYAWMLVQLGGGPDVFADSAKDWPERVAMLLETFRTADNGYAKTPGGASGSTYHTFLVALCYEMLGKPLPQPDAVAQFIRSRQREDGGYVEIAQMRRGGTNPTAAAVAMLQMLPDAGFSTEEGERVAGFLAEMPSLEGGLRANGRAPLADLLSTFTGVLTLQALGALDRIDIGETREYVEGLDQPDGGFHGGLWDEGSDVEYTFYGIGCFALLSSDKV